MQDVLRDPLWQFVGVILTIVVPVILYFVQRKRKSLAYEVISETPILSITEEVAGQLEILFQGDPVEQVHLIVYRLSNTGNVPIKSEDYERAVGFRFNDDARVLTAEITKTEPRNLNAEISVKEQSIQISPVLLNQRDSILVKALVSNYQKLPYVDGRIIGVKSITQRPEKGDPVKPQIVYSYWFLSLLGLILSIINPSIAPGILLVVVPFSVGLTFVWFFMRAQH